MTPTLANYRIDRADGLTAFGGAEKLIILVLKVNGSAAEFAVAISKIDAIRIALQLQSAATEVQSEQYVGR